MTTTMLKEKLPQASIQHSILRVALPVPLAQCFDYRLPPHYSPENLLPGVRVEVPFGSRKLIGIVLETDSHSEFTKLKKAYRIIDDAPILSLSLLKLCQWMSYYYHAPIGEVIALVMPQLIRQGKPAMLEKTIHYCLTDEGNKADVSRAPKQAAIVALLKNNALSEAQLKEHEISRPALRALKEKAFVDVLETDVLPECCKSPQKKTFELTSAQSDALSVIAENTKHFNVSLLNGVTGSGKTQVYLDGIANVIKAGKQALVLVPEIGLTPQTITRFKRYFDVPVVAFHSGLNDKERLNAWLHAKRGVAKIVIGTRSAVFLPMPELGLIVLDEEHDLSFKQQDGVRYSARDVAIKRAQMCDIPVVLGSATPSLESYYNATQGRYHHLQLPERAGASTLPKFTLVDLKKKKMEHGLSIEFIDMICQHLARGEQVLLFLNRRGFSPVLMCHSCGWMAECTRCDARFTYHMKKNLIQCHHCDKIERVPPVCPACSLSELQGVGVGTQRLEEALTSHFPNTDVLRIDRDSTRKKGSLKALFDRIHSGEPKILVGTQMLAKGHHFPNVTLVGIVNVDEGLFSHDFRGVERMAQLIVQVAGRAGRAEKPGVVALQTHHSDHPLLQQLLRFNYNDFADTLLEQRKPTGFPPFGYLAVLRAEATTDCKPLDFLQAAAQLIRGYQIDGVRLMGPAPSAMPKKAGRYRAECLLQSTDRRALHRVLSGLKGALSGLPEAKHVRWVLDVDPTDTF